MSLISSLLLLSMISSAQVSSEEVAKLVEQLHLLYQPVVQSEGARFVIETKPESESVVASADRPDVKTYQLSVHGGMIRSSRVNLDGLRMALCHEIGHLFGGPPLREAPFDWEGPRDPSGFSLLSGEGQSDFYAALVCFRRLVAGEDHRVALQGRPPSPRLQSLCEAGFPGDVTSQRLCLRSAWAGFQMLNMVADFPISFDSPDLTPTPRTLHGLYPSRQCRLDIFAEASACRNGFPLDLRGINLDSCPRQSCWYRQKNSSGAN